MAVFMARGCPRGGSSAVFDESVSRRYDSPEMTLKTHTATSALLAALIYGATASVSMAAAALLGGIFIDLDHVADFLLFSGERFTSKNLFEWFDVRWERSIFPFHTYEGYLALAFLHSRHPHPLLTGLLLGVGLHFLLDQIGNRYCLKHYSIRPPFYFFIFRAVNGFSKARMLEPKVNKQERELKAPSLEDAPE